MGWCVKLLVLALVADASLGELHRVGPALARSRCASGEPCDAPKTLPSWAKAATRETAPEDATLTGVSFLQTRFGLTGRAALSEEEREAEEVALAVERRFKDVSSGLSLAACAKRAHNDLSLTFQQEIRAQMTTQFIMIVLEAIGNVIMMIFCIIAAMCLIEMLGGPLGEAIGEMMMKAIEPFVIIEIAPTVEERLGGELLVDVTENLLNKVGQLVVMALTFHVPRAMAKELPSRLTNYVVRVEAPYLAKGIAHNIIHAITHKVIHNLSHVLVETAALQVTDMLSHQIVNYYYCVYCYQKGQFCRECQTYNQFRSAGAKVR